MKQVTNFHHPAGWTLFAILPGTDSPMENHLHGEVAADDAARRFYVHEIYLVQVGLGSIEAACRLYPTDAAKVPSDEAYLKSVQALLTTHHARSTLTTSSGLLAVRDTSQRLWFYYEWRDGHYQVTGSTRRHPKFY